MYYEPTIIALAYAISPSNSPDADFDDDMDELREKEDKRERRKWTDALVEKYVPGDRAKVMGNCKVCGKEIHLCESFRYTGRIKEVLCSDGETRASDMLCERHW